MATFQSERQQEQLRGQFYTLKGRGADLLDQLQLFENEIVALRAETVDVEKQGEIDTQRSAFVTQVKVILGI